MMILSEVEKSELEF